MVRYWVFNQENEVVASELFSTDASARRWFQQRGFNKPGWVLSRELNDEMIQIRTM